MLTLINYKVYKPKGFIRWNIELKNQNHSILYDIGKLQFYKILEALHRDDQSMFNTIACYMQSFCSVSRKFNLKGIYHEKNICIWKLDIYSHE